MTKFEFSMKYNDRKVMLDAILARLTAKGEITWVLHYFDGVGIAPNREDMADFEDRLRSNPEGFRMSDNELASFSKSIFDLNEISAVGFLLR